MNTTVLIEQYNKRFSIIIKESFNSSILKTINSSNLIKSKGKYNVEIYKLSNNKCLINTLFDDKLQFLHILDVKSYDVINIPIKEKFQIIFEHPEHNGSFIIHSNDLFQHINIDNGRLIFNYINNDILYFASNNNISSLNDIYTKSKIHNIHNYDLCAIVYNRYVLLSRSHTILYDIKTNECVTVNYEYNDLNYINIRYMNKYAIISNFNTITQLLYIDQDIGLINTEDIDGKVIFMDNLGMIIENKEDYQYILHIDINNKLDTYILDNKKNTIKSVLVFNDDYILNVRKLVCDIIDELPLVLRKIISEY